MIELSTKFDLGRDTTRMKDPRDAARQRKTAKELLERFTSSANGGPWPLQLLADEVGMGKTFVSLAVAFSLLEHMDRGGDAEFEGCYSKVLIVAPNNSALLGKWTREVGEFVKRCLPPEQQADARKWFKAARCDHLEEFVRKLKEPGRYPPRVLIAPMNLFQGKKIQNLELKQQFMLAALFRHWGNSLQNTRRERLLQYGHKNWPKDPTKLGILSTEQRSHLPCDVEEAQDYIARTDRRERQDSPFPKILEACRAVTEDHQRGREEVMEKLKRLLNETYRGLLAHSIKRDIPLVMIDEAHNWKNGPTSGANGYDGFRQHVASRTRRTLLLTATPFQLRPAEMLQLMRIGLDTKFGPSAAESKARLTPYEHHLTKVIKPTLEDVEDGSRSFAKAWGQLDATDADPLTHEWSSSWAASCRNDLTALTTAHGKVEVSILKQRVDASVANAPQRLRSFLKAALVLFACNQELTAELGRVVIRHRRRADHRLFLVGSEFTSDRVAASTRPDRHVMHASNGIDVRGDAELPHYLLMRCIAELRQAGHKTSLGSAITGCYSTLFDSAEGKMLEAASAASESARMRIDLLKGLADAQQDAAHPKVAAVVESVLRAWDRGEKTLLFCFRVNNARQLGKILHARVEERLAAMRAARFASEEQFKNFRERLTRREDSLIQLLLDRPLWSLRVCAPEDFAQVNLRLQESDLPELAARLAEHGHDPEKKTDWALMQRAVDHVIARRVHAAVVGDSRRFVDEMRRPEWIARPYGLEAPEESGDDKPHEELRGADHVFEKAHASKARIESVLLQLRQRFCTSESGGVEDPAAGKPSLWFGANPSEAPVDTSERLRHFHRCLRDLSSEDGAPDWLGRRMVFEALRRIATRDAVLLRLLPHATDDDAVGIASTLASNFWSLSPEGQSETMADRVSVFLEGLTGESGTFTDKDSARFMSLQSTRVGHEDYVAVVGGGDNKNRERLFGGFNSPLLPEILVCTSVGSEGIDLHKYCRHVIHYDLAWNPAVIEQRTGRIDRIGSKTFRERTASNDTRLEIGMPFLAGTYDERMFEELRLRAQVFEVMTGGDMARDEASGSDEISDADPVTESGAGRPTEGQPPEQDYLLLPDALVDDMRVKLHVWSE